MSLAIHIASDLAYYKVLTHRVIKLLPILHLHGTEQLLGALLQKLLLLDCFYDLILLFLEFFLTDITSH